jgi:hypothetical protein
MFPSFKRAGLYCLSAIFLLLLLALPSPNKVHAIGKWPKAPFGIPTSGFIGFLYDEPVSKGVVHAGVDICTANNCSSTAEGNEVRAAYGGKLVAIYNDQVQPLSPSNPVAAIVVLEQDNISLPGMPMTVYSWYLHMAKDGSSISYVNPQLVLGHYYPAGTFLGHQGNRRVLGICCAVTHLHFQVQTNDTDLFFKNSLDPSPFLGPNVNFTKSGHLHRGDALNSNLPTVGNFWATGHDPDFHCSQSAPSAGAQCHYLQIAVDFVMRGSQLPLLALDHGTQVHDAVSNAFGSTSPITTNLQTVDPRSQFASVKLLDSSGKPRFSAIIVASDITCGGCDNNIDVGNTPDSDAINARAAAIVKFNLHGGGVLALAGAQNGATYYKFFGVTSTNVAPPFTLTSTGLFLGLVEGSDDNCCATHNSFINPNLSGILVAETDHAGTPETLVNKEL